MRNVTSAALLAAGLLTGFATVSAQTPAPQTSSSPQSPATPSTTTQQPSSMQASAAMMSIVGCLKEEKDVAGLQPNVVERAGITEDYILTDVKAAPGNSVSGLALGAMYEIEGIAESELKKHLGHQVEIQGRIDATDGGARDRKDVPDFNATSIKMLSATCPAK